MKCFHSYLFYVLRDDCFICLVSLISPPCPGNPRLVTGVTSLGLARTCYKVHTVTTKLLEECAGEEENVKLVLP